MAKWIGRRVRAVERASRLGFGTRLLINLGINRRVQPAGRIIGERERVAGRLGLG